MNYLQKKKLAFMSIVNRVKGFVRTVVGLPPLVLPDCVGDNLINYSISGNSVQDGTPTPDNPIEIESVGEYDEAMGKYKIPIAVRGKNLIKVAGRTRGYPSDIAASNTTKRTFDFDTYIVGMNGNNWYVPTNIGNNFSINEDNSVTLKSSNVSYGIGFPIPLKPNTAYFTPVCDNNHNYNNIGISIYKSNGEFSYSTSYGNTVSITTKEDETIGMIIVKANASNTEDTISNIFMEENLTKTSNSSFRSDYEPYQEPTETAIYLDEPLRKVGDVADYIDFENSKVVRNIKTQYLDANYNSITKYTWVNKVGVYFGVCLDNAYERIPGLSNRNAEFTANPQATTSMWLGIKNKNFFWIGILNYLGFEDDDNSTAVDKFKEWLADNPTYIHYPTSTPIEEPINLPNIPTLKGATILSPNTTVQPSNMSATYYSTSKE